MVLLCAATAAQAQPTAFTYQFIVNTVAAGYPVLFHHGTPAAGLVYEPHAALAHEQGIRLIGYDRPGYAGCRANGAISRESR